MDHNREMSSVGEPSTVDLNIVIREKKLEDIRLFLSNQFPKNEETRETTLNFVVEYFHSKYADEIMKANQE